MPVQNNRQSCSSVQIQFNRSVHDSIAPLYEGHHPEIFNRTEQLRIGRVLRSLKEEFGITARPYVLDYGAGTGNLTRHLLELGATVVAAEVSEGCLRELRAGLGQGSNYSTVLVNGCNLELFADEMFDLVSTYSVLHHVPDYLKIVDEFVRVTKPGGFIYIDHEVCPAYWEDGPDYREYVRELEELEEKGTDLLERFGSVLKRKGLWRYVCALLNRRLRGDADEGDIHVHLNDHIEWSVIRKLIEQECEIMKENDYLICREQAFPAPVWEKWHERCTDMRLIIARKR